MTLTRADLRQALQDTGEFTYTEARLAVNTIINILKDKLIKNKKLELPIGTLTVMHPRSYRAYRLGKIVSIGKKTKVHFKRNKDG